MTYNPSMKKKTRKAIVYSAVYILIAWIPASLVAEFTNSPEPTVPWIIFSIPVVIYWVRKFIDAGAD